MAMLIDNSEDMDLDPIIDAFVQRNHGAFAYQPWAATDDTFCPSPESFLVQPGASNSPLLDSAISYPVHMPKLDTFDQASPVPVRESMTPQLRRCPGYDDGTGRKLYYQTQYQVGNYQHNNNLFADGVPQSLSPDLDSSLFGSPGSDSISFADVSSYSDPDSAMTDSTSSLSINALDMYTDLQANRFDDGSLYDDCHHKCMRLAQSQIFQEPIDLDSTRFSDYTIDSTHASWSIARARELSAYSAISRLPREFDKPDANMLPLTSRFSLPWMAGSSLSRLPRLGEINSAGASKATRGPINEREDAQVQTSPTLRIQVRSQASNQMVTKGSNELNIHILERPTGKRKLETHSGPKRDVWRKAKSACFACVWAKQACEVNDNGACTRCQKVMKQMTHLMPLPRFTCSTRTVFASLSIFTSPYPQMAIGDRTKSTPAYPTPSPEPITLSIEPFLPILEALDPNIVRRSSLQSCVNPILTLSYLRNIVQWKEASSIMFPEHSNLLIAIERRYRDWMYDVLYHMDNVARGKIDATTTVSLFLLYDEICALGSLPSVDHAAVQHLRNTIEHYMILLRSNLLNSAVPRDEPRAPKKRKKNHLRKESDHELFLKLPLHLRLILISSGTRKFLPLECTQATLLYHTEIDSTTCPQCPIQHPTLKKSEPLPSNTTCLCSLALDCLPTDFFRPFSLSVPASDTCRRIHSLMFHADNISKAAFMYSAMLTNHDEEALSWFAAQYRQIISRLMQCYFECIVATVAHDTGRDRVLRESKSMRTKWKDVFAKVLVYIPAYGVKLFASLVDWVIETREDALSAVPGDHVERWLQDSSPSALEGIRGQMVYILRKRLAKFEVVLNLYKAEVKASKS